MTKDTKTINRINNFINKQEIIYFLNFIHSLNIRQLEIHNLFLEYLLFEDQVTSDESERTKVKSQYLKTLREASATVTRKTGGNAASLLIQSEKFTDAEGNVVKNSEKKLSYTKKNIIIIEILENFLIDDGKENIYVDIEKLKMLLPQSCNIDKNYIKKIIYTNIKLINKAVNKLKKEKKASNQYYLLNKTLNAALELDRDIDREIAKAYNTKVLENLKKEGNIDGIGQNHYEQLLTTMNSIKHEIKTVLDTKSKELELKIKS